MPIWKLEAALSADHQLTETGEIAPYAWVNPDEDHKATLLEIGVLEHCLEHCWTTAWSIAQAQASARSGTVSMAFSIVPTRRR
jgi:hypothetical protein